MLPGLGSLTPRLLHLGSFCRPIRSPGGLGLRYGVDYLLSNGGVGLAAGEHDLKENRSLELLDRLARLLPYAVG